MAKITKGQLKRIVKECLIEILSEGIGDTQRSSSSRMSTYNVNESTARASKSRSPTHGRPSLDNVSFSQSDNSNSQNSEVLKEDINTLTDDPIMQSIFADTHATTVVRQVESGTSHMSEAVAIQGDNAARAMAQNDPMDVFGDAADKWATLAFSSGKASL